ncbi:MAG: DUF2238 domain-containing protein [Mariniphaga sp.]|nr:DUF2238 domain-containing protein [Mariniphaga sp.]
MKIVYFWKPGIWLLIICYLSLIPGDGLPSVPIFNIPHFDKIVHLGFYFIFTILIIKPFLKITKWNYFFALVIATLLSGCIEILQEKVAVLRHGDLNDFLANFAGIILAIIFYRIFISEKKIEQFF